MAEQPCLPQVQAVRLRVAKLLASGIPEPGASNLYVTDALVTLTATPVYVDGDEIEQKNAAGAVCVNYVGDDSFKRIDLSIQMCTWDPYLGAWFSDGDTLTAFDGGRVGYAGPSIGVVGTTAVSIEVWTNRIDDGSLDTESPYCWHAYPRVKNLRISDWTHENGALLPTFTGRAFENPNWYDGPLNDWTAASDRCHQWVPTDTLPTAACGPAQLVAS
jgi:hypothetical protein